MFEERNWLCLRANGTGGGTFFCVAENSDWPGNGLLVARRIPSMDESWEIICGGGDDIGGGRGRGLLRSEFVLSLESGEDGGGDAKDEGKSENETVCGVLGVTSLPCRCLGGGGFRFSGFLVSPTKLTRSSSSEAAISYDVRGDSECGS